MEINDILKQVAGNSVFAFMLVILWRYMIDMLDKKDGIVERKDLELKQLNEKVLTAFNENTKATIQTNVVVDNNTKAVENLTDRIYDILTDKK